MEPLSVGWHAVKVSPFKKGDAALILGGGPIGIAVILALKANGADKIIVSEVSQKRQEFAKNFGADYVINPMEVDIVQRCKDLCDGQGVDVVYDCAGVQAALNQGVRATRARGTIVNIAIWEKDCSISTNELNFKERKYMGVATFAIGDFREVIVSIDVGRSEPSVLTNTLQDAISAGKIQPQDMITKTVKLTEVEEKGFKALINDKDNNVKVLVEVHGG